MLARNTRNGVSSSHPILFSRIRRWSSLQVASPSKAIVSPTAANNKADGQSKALAIADVSSSSSSSSSSANADEGDDDEGEVVKSPPTMAQILAAAPRLTMGGRYPPPLVVRLDFFIEIGFLCPCQNDCMPLFRL